MRGNIESSITQAEWAIGLTVVAAAAAAWFTFGGSAAAGAGGVGVIVTNTVNTIRTVYQGSNLLKAVGLATAAAGAVGLIKSFDKVPDLGTTLTSLATIIAMRVLIEDDGESTSDTTPPATAAAFPPQQAVDKIPTEWGEGQPNRKKDGERWHNPENPNGAGVRIDKGDPNSPNQSQRVDHVVVRSDGKVLGPDGQPIPPGSSIKNHPEAHIPLEEWLKWKSWDHP